ncbi:MAG: hypothetical protein Q8Q33_03835 [Chlamydiota bacterium]|nr:hypothetical protein [Chlamydiota bacterium]
MLLIKKRACMVFLFICLGGASIASADLIDWMDKGIKKENANARFKGYLNGAYRATLYSEENVLGQDTSLGSSEHEFFLTVPVYYRSADAAVSTINFNYRNTDTKAVFPATGQLFPQDLYLLDLGLVYRHQFENDWTGGTYITFGSASNELFASADEMAYSGTVFLKVPHREKHAWLFVLNISNNREFLRDIPIPGIGYLYNPSPNLHAVIGMPYEALSYRPFEKLSLQFIYLPVRTVFSECEYTLFKQWKIYSGFRWYNDRHMLADRPVEDERLYFYEKRVYGGLRYKINDTFSADLSGGYAFDRMYFIGETYKDRNENRIDIADGPFISIKCILSF